MYDFLVKAAIIVFLVIPLVGTTLAFVISAMVMQIQDDIKHAEVKPHESGC